MELDGLMLATGPRLETWLTGPTNWWLVIEVRSNWPRSEKSAISQKNKKRCDMVASLQKKRCDMVANLNLATEWM